MAEDQRVIGLLLALAKALKTREATVAWAQGVTQDDLERVWNACPDGRALMRLCAPLTSPQVLVQAACACIQVALAAQGGDDRRVRAAVDRLESWSREAATWAQVEAAGNAVMAELDGGSSDVTDALAAAAMIPQDPSLAMGSVESVALALSNDDTVYASSAAKGAPPPRKTKQAVLAELAELIRTIVPCPSVEQLARDPAPRP